jgi:hypothetical protein
VRIPVYLAIAQWVLLFSLGVLVIVMYRHLGRHFNLAKPDIQLGPAVGSSAVGFEYAQVADATVQRFTPGHGRAALIAFVGPTCPACEELVTALGEARDNGELDSVRALLLISEPPSYLQISEPFRTTKLEIGEVLANATREAYRASATPVLVAIDGAGVVRSAGPATELAEVRAFVQACLVPMAGHAALPVLPGREQVQESTTITEDEEVRLA